MIYQKMLILYINVTTICSSLEKPMSGMNRGTSGMNGLPYFKSIIKFILVFVKRLLVLASWSSFILNCLLTIICDEVIIFPYITPYYTVFHARITLLGIFPIQRFLSNSFTQQYLHASFGFSPMHISNKTRLKCITKP